MSSLSVIFDVTKFTNPCNWWDSVTAGRLDKTRTV
jgi:hypothetical protein